MLCSISTLVHHVNLKAIMFTNLCFHWDRSFQHSIMRCKNNQCYQRYKKLEVVIEIIPTMNDDLECNNTIHYDTSTNVSQYKISRVDADGRTDKIIISVKVMLNTIQI